VNQFYAENIIKFTILLTVWPQLGRKKRVPKRSLYSSPKKNEHKKLYSLFITILTHFHTQRDTRKKDGVENRISYGSHIHTPHMLTICSIVFWAACASIFSCFFYRITYTHAIEWLPYVKIELFPRLILAVGHTRTHVH